MPEDLSLPEPQMVLAQALAPLQAFAENFGQMLNQIAPHNLLASLMSGGQIDYYNWRSDNFVPHSWALIQSSGVIRSSLGTQIALGRVRLPSGDYVHLRVYATPSGDLYYWTWAEGAGSSQAYRLGSASMPGTWSGSWGRGNTLRPGMPGRPRYGFKYPTPPPTPTPGWYRPPGKEAVIGGDIESAFF